MTGNEIFQRTPAYERDTASIRLHAPQWKLLLAYDGQRTLAELALSVEIPFADALPLTEKFLEKGWIEEQPITLDQYLKRSGSTTLSAVGTAVPPVVLLHSPQPEAAQSPSQPIVEPVVATPPVPVQAKSIVVPPPPVLNPPAFTPPKPIPIPVPRPVAVPTAVPRGPMKLGAVVESIISTVSNRSLGQLLVYRVFLRVSPELLMSENISTIHLVNDPSLIKSEALQRAIANAVSEIVKRPLPESVFAAA